MDDLGVAVLGSRVDGEVSIGSRIDAIISEQEADDVGAAILCSYAESIV